jgi:hypothetical protein
MRHDLGTSAEGHSGSIFQRKSGTLGNQALVFFHDRLRVLLVETSLDIFYGRMMQAILFLDLEDSLYPIACLGTKLFREKAGIM